MQARIKAPLPRVVIQDALDKILPTITSAEDLKNKLKTEGIETRFRKRKDKTISGISFGYNGIAFGGGKLGKRYSWTRIEQQLRENQASSVEQPENHLQKIYNRVNATIPTEMNSSTRDIAIACRLLKEGKSSKVVKAILTQSPVVQSYKQRTTYQRDKAISYIDVIHRKAQKALNQKKVKEKTL